MSTFTDAQLTSALPSRNGGISRILKRAGWIGVAAALTLVGGCAGSRGGSIPYHPPESTFGAPDSPALAALETDYRIAPLDKLKVNVFQVEDLSGEFQVDLLGNISLPLVGNIRAVDLTSEQLDDKITAALAEKYMRSPDVSIGILESSSRTVTIDGSVRQPGMFPVTSPLTLIQAIALARGTDENANPRRVAVFRKIEGQRMAAAFDLTDIRRGKVEDPRIYSGDIVVVDGSSVKQIQRELLQALPVVSLFRPY